MSPLGEGLFSEDSKEGYLPVSRGPLSRCTRGSGHLFVIDVVEGVSFWFWPLQYIAILITAKLFRYIEFFAFDYDSLPISFQLGIAVFL